MELNECFELKKKDNGKFNCDACVISNLSNGYIYVY